MTDTREQALVAALREFLKLLDDKVLVRNISSDHDFIEFTKQAIRIGNAVGNATALLPKEEQP